MDTINQKEYLKKYLGIGKVPGEKKKKKKIKGVANRVKIIDDDVEDFTNNIVDEDPLLANEDAPQIVAIIDERPPSLRVDEKTKNPLWQPIGSTDTISLTKQKQMITGFKIAPPKSNDKSFARPADRSPPRRRKIVHDNSPSRKSKSNDYSPPRKKTEFDNSPRISKSDDNSPPREKSVIADNSPPRKSRNDDNSPPRKYRSDDRSPRVRNVDYSPPRRSKHNDISPPRKSRKDDISSPRKNRKPNDYSPPRRSKQTVHNIKYDNAPPRKQEKKKTDNKEDRRTKYSNEEQRSSKMDKTLDGKKAGLQNAEQLAEESKHFRSREDQLFKNLPQEVSGENAKTIFRDRKSGKIRNPAEEEERQQKKREEEEKNKEKYSRWGRGLVQVESRDQQVKEELYEMSKPLARYADDEDLEKFLKEQEREGDPMLAYIRSKKRKEAAKAGVVTKPEFEGQFMPNRFGIKPGHRWDGVDRSNGYEKRWFEVQNAKRAQQEDTYKWSTEDM
ncbi:BUD13 -like protein [Asbolus verrucosus]|uniref:BUD13 homolog n=1 Tax=Asbolus verrucosus TaxID=1661398 RepID=A0A482WDN1_ASBVE|nr:BUD13 -like protein [Asbolus verrucosus]